MTDLDDIKEILRVSNRNKMIYDIALKIVGVLLFIMLLILFFVMRGSWQFTSGCQDYKST